MNNDEYKRIAEAALNSVDSLLAAWLPSGKYERHEYVALNPNRADKKLGSFKINTHSGVWSDFAAGESGGDLIALYAYLFCGGKQGEALKEVREWLGMDLPTPPREKFQAQKSSGSQKDDWQPIAPFAESCLNIFEKSKSFQYFIQELNYKAGLRSVYRNGGGEPIFVVQRFIKPNGEKDDRPFSWCEKVGEDAACWKSRRPSQILPLFGLDELAQNPDKIVLLVEGEKCKQAAHNADLGVVVVTWHGGTNNWDNSDWSPLAGRKVILWADADSKRIKPNNQQIQAGMTDETAPFLHKYKQGGMKAMLGVAEKLTELGCDCVFVRLPECGVLPDGYDIADALEEGVNAKLPVRDILSWQNMGDWLIDFASLKADFAKVFALSKKRSECAAESDKIAENQNAHSQHVGVFAGQTQGGDAKSANDDEFGKISPSQNLLDNLLKNYAVIGQKEKAINLQSGEMLSRRHLEKIFTKDVVFNWFYSKEQQKLPEFEAEILSKKLILQAKAKNSDFANVLNRYIYLDGTTDAYDIKLDDIVSLAAVKAAIPDEFDDWAKSPARLVCPISNYVFDPSLPPGISFDEDEQTGERFVSYINKFNGFDIEFNKLPEMGQDVRLQDMYPQFSGCQEIINLISHLCSGNGDVSARVLRWVLCWLACRLRFPHEKPPTTLVFISEVQGVGKSTFADKILKGLFTRYYRKLNQNALESRFNSLLKFALVTVFEEIAPSDERMNVIGKLKDMISGETLVIENKGRDAQEFADFNSYVINSNDARSIPVETNDRRFMVMHCKERYSEEAHERLMLEIGNGGLSVFADFLHALPLFYEDGEGVWRKFTPHSKPIMTPIKRRMIGLSRQSWEAFFEAWKNGEIEGLPFVSCRKKDLWAVYVWWCDYTKTFKMSADKFFNSIACKFERVYRTECLIDSERKKIDVFVLSHDEINGDKYLQPNTNQVARSGLHGKVVTMAEYLGGQVVDFHAAARVFLHNLPPL